MWSRLPHRSPLAPRFFALLLAGLLGVARVGAQGVPSAEPASPDSAVVPAGPQLVGTISVAGNIAVDSARIVRTFEMIPGTRFSAEAVQRGIRKLFTLGLFEDAWVDRQDRGDRVDLVIHVKERPRISAIHFTGNKKRETGELEKKLFLRAGHPYSAGQVSVQVDSLLFYYREEGFPRARITPEVKADSANNQMRIDFVIEEGERVRITQIEVVGVKAFSPVKIRKQLSTKQRGWFGGGEYKDERFEEDKEKIVAYLRNRGYRDAQVLGHELKQGAKPRDLTLVFTVEEGPYYTMGNVLWTGNTVVPEMALERLWRPRVGEPYDRSKVEKVQGLAYAEYAEAGYLYLNIEPREVVRDHEVDVKYFVSEGSPSNVRMIHITGNLGTREKVIRREIDIHEGDRFRRSALVRSQGDVFRLGFFEDVQLDFAPADSSDVDLLIKVKEKQVGTASAGAGYTAQSGMTGFLELGHNNVLGNGQTLSLHLERGARRSDYYLSFTEPWFRDTPTLLGTSVFNTNRQLDLYTERRAGVSARVGRPLAWPDYSRGSIGYNLENVTIKIDKPESTFTVQDSIVLRGVVNAQPVLTSSVNLSFNRNNTNNPFYPTGGSRFSIDSEIAGGPWGGSVNFHKTKIEARAYLPSLARIATTMARVRFGLLGEYPDQDFPVPDYERFRLGGGTTPDPLRGYDDYMVVPEKFIRPVANVLVRFPGTDSARTDTVSYSIVRYPGGRIMLTMTLEQQFPIAHPLHGVIFFDAGNTWDLLREVRPFDLRLSAGIGFRLEIPLLGNIGFDYGYGFDRRELGDNPRFVGHLLIGQTFF